MVAVVSPTRTNTDEEDEVTDLTLEDHLVVVWHNGLVTQESVGDWSAMRHRKDACEDSSKEQRLRLKVGQWIRENVPVRETTMDAALSKEECNEFIAMVKRRLQDSGNGHLYNQFLEALKTFAQHTQDSAEPHDMVRERLVKKVQSILSSFPGLFAQFLQGFMHQGKSAVRASAPKRVPAARRELVMSSGGVDVGATTTTGGDTVGASSCGAVVDASAKPSRSRRCRADQSTAGQNDQNSYGRKRKKPEKYE